MDKLDATTLYTLFKTPISNYLEPTAIDVTRLRDDRSDIQLGDEVAFVATAAFRVTSLGASTLASAVPGGLQVLLRDLAKEDVLFSIGADGELVSSTVPLDNDSVAQWVTDNYDFAFLLNGARHAAFGPVGRVRLSPDDTKAMQSRTLPWIQKLNTAAIKEDYIDIDVRLEPAPPSATTTAAGFLEYEVDYRLRTNTHAVLPAARMVLRVPVAHLAERAIKIPLDDHPDGAHLQIVFDEVKSVPVLPPPQDPPTTNKPKHSPKP
jgi:hypothetical protein